MITLGSIYGIDKLKDNIVEAELESLNGSVTHMPNCSIVS